MEEPRWQMGDVLWPFRFFPSACEITTLWCTPRAEKKTPCAEHPLIVNDGEYPPGLTRKVGGILVMISFSPLIFPAPFCGLWRIWGTLNLVPELYPFRRSPFLKSPGDKAEASLVSKKYVWCSYGKRNFWIMLRGSVLGTGQLDCH